MPTAFDPILDRPARTPAPQPVLRSGDPHDRDPFLDIPGMAPNMGQDVLPHVVTFQGLLRNVARTYYISDEAIQHSWDNARFMRNDPGIMECLEMRQRSVALLGWHLEAEDEKDSTQKFLVDNVTTLIRHIPNFLKYRENLLHALWYGKYGVAHRYNWRKVGQHQRLVVDSWRPVNGDKLVFRYDDGSGEFRNDQVGIRVGAGYTEGNRIANRFQVERFGKVAATDRGLAYFLEHWERPLIAIHKHMIEDAEYEAPDRAGAIHGVGIRNRLYWLWYQKQETLAWLMEYLERSAFGIEIWTYPAGNAAALEMTKKAAQERIGDGRNIVLVPRHPDSDVLSSDVKRIEPGMAGAEVLDRIIREYFGHQIKRYILGQILTSEAASTGLGSGVASIHLDTYLQIVRYDAINLAETITTDLVKPLIAYNWPKYADVPIRFVIETETPEVDAKLGAWKSAFEMGLRIPARDVAELIGSQMPEQGDEVLESSQFQQLRLQEQQLRQQSQMQQAQMQQQEQQAKAARRQVAMGGAELERFRATKGKHRAGEDSDTKPGWKTVGGGSRVFIGAGGKILAGCPGLKGEDVDDIGEDEQPENRKRREHRQEDDPNADFAAALWDILDEERASAIPMDDPGLLREAAELVLANQGYDPGAVVTSSYEEFRRRGGVERYRRWRGENRDRTLYAKEDSQGNLHDESNGRFVQKGKGAADDGKFAPKAGDIAANPIEITGREFGVDWEDPHVRERLIPQIVDALRGKKFHNRDTGKDIRVGKRSVKKVFSHLPDAKPAMAMAKLPEILESAVWIREAPNRTPDQNIKKWHYFVVPVMLESVEHLAHIKIREDNNGHWFYDHELTIASDKEKEDLPYKLGTPEFGSASAGKSSTEIIGPAQVEVKQEPPERDDRPRFSKNGDGQSEKLRGGLADGTPDSAFDPAALIRGFYIERERGDWFYDQRIDLFKEKGSPSRPEEVPEEHAKPAGEPSEAIIGPQQGKVKGKAKDREDYRASGEDRLPGGPADFLSDLGFSPEALAEGTKHELEHIEKPASYGKEPTSPGAMPVSVPPAGFNERINALVSAVKGEGVSKAVDSQGRPLVLYHGTSSREPFSEFSVSAPQQGFSSINGEGFYFTDNVDRAHSYAEGPRETPGSRMLDWSGHDQRILPVYLDIKNPLEVDAEAKSWREVMSGIVDRAKAAGHDGVIVRNVRDPGSGQASNIGRKAGLKDFEGPLATEYMSTTYIAFRPEQIKSATGNRGTFERENPDIRYQKWDESKCSRDEAGRFATTPTHESIGDLVHESLSTTRPSEGQARKWVEYRGIDKNEASRLREQTGLELDGYAHTVDDSAIRHIWRFHGPHGSAIHGGQIPLTLDDLEKIPEITKSADEVRYAGKTRHGLDAVEFKKRINGFVYYIEEVRTNRKELAAVTMRKLRDDKKSDPVNPSLLTSETLRQESARGVADQTATGIVGPAQVEVKQEPPERDDRPRFSKNGDGQSEKLRGGLADGTPDSAFDPAALIRGFYIEHEHTDDAEAAWEIAKDHLAERQDYYDRLEEIEEAPADSLAERIEKAARKTARRPSDEQKAAGNYRKGKCRLHGLEIAIETPKGAVRSGRNKTTGEDWSIKMPYHFGYIKRTESEADGDHVDVFLGPDPDFTGNVEVLVPAKAGRIGEPQFSVRRFGFGPDPGPYDDAR